LPEPEDADVAMDHGCPRTPIDAASPKPNLAKTPQLASVISGREKETTARDGREIGRTQLARSEGKPANETKVDAVKEFKVGFLPIEAGLAS
jgi:hypothetical protein